jgi:F-type H+-transporting ATPase subunit delta
MAKLVAATYGEALYKVALEELGPTLGNKVDLLMQEVKEMSAVLEANPEFDRFMKHPGIPGQEKLNVMDHVFQRHISQDMAGLLHTVVTKGRYGDLRAIFGYFLNKVKEEKKIGTVYVTTAVPMDETQKKQVRERILATAGYRDLEVHYQVDASIIGGMVIRIKDRVVDSSIRNKLDNMTKQLLQIRLG